MLWNRILGGGVYHLLRFNMLFNLGFFRRKIIQKLILSFIERRLVNILQTFKECHFFVSYVNLTLRSHIKVLLNEGAYFLIWRNLELFVAIKDDTPQLFLTIFINKGNFSLNWRKKLRTLVFQIFVSNFLSNNLDTTFFELAAELGRKQTHRILSLFEIKYLCSLINFNKSTASEHILYLAIRIFVISLFL